MVKEKSDQKGRKKKGRKRGEEKDMDRGFFHFLWRCLMIELIDFEGLKVSWSRGLKPASEMT